MISLYMQPDLTLVMQGKIRKDNTFEVIETVELPSYYEAFSQGGTESVFTLVRMFRDLRAHFPVNSQEIYIVLPDVIFNTINCYEYISGDSLRIAIEEDLQESLNNYYYVIPVHTVPPASIRRSVYTLEKPILDDIIEAAKQEKITLSSVEPASFAFYRAAGNWEVDTPLVEIFKESACIVTYSPTDGIFRLDCDRISEHKLEMAKERVDSVVSEVYSANLITESQKFSIFRPGDDVHYTVLTNRPNILAIEAIRMRLPKDMPGFPEYVEPGNIMPDEQTRWMPLLGTLLQEYDARDSLNNPLYDKLPQIVQLRTANLLPEDVRTSSRNQQWRGMLQKTSKGLIATFLGVMAIEAVAIFCLSTEIPASLQSDYATVQKEGPAVDAEIGVVRAALAEDQNVPAAYEALVRNRPDGLGFASVTIGLPNVDQKKGTSGDNRYASVRVVSNNELTFETFRGQLSSEPIFDAPVINNITAENNLKTAELKIAKGAMKP